MNKTAIYMSFFTGLAIFFALGIIVGNYESFQKSSKPDQKYEAKFIGYVQDNYSRSPIYEVEVEGSKYLATKHASAFFLCPKIEK